MRLMAVDAAAAAELSVDRAGDLELAVAEAGAILLSLQPAQLGCVLEQSEKRVIVTMHAAGPTVEADVNELSALVLDAVAESIAVDVVSSAPSVAFTIAALPTHKASPFLRFGVYPAAQPGKSSARTSKGNIMGLLGFLIVGLIAGAIARLLVPGSDSFGILGTMILGIVGSFVGGLLAALVFSGSIELNASGIVGSIIGAVIALVAYRSLNNRSVTA